MTALAVAALLVVAAVLLWAWRVRLDAVLGRRRAAADAPRVARGSSAPGRRLAPLINPRAVVRMRVDQDPNHFATCQAIWDLPEAQETPGGGHG